jgi:hypothetical protein
MNERAGCTDTTVAQCGRFAEPTAKTIVPDIAETQTLPAELHQRAGSERLSTSHVCVSGPGDGLSKHLLAGDSPVGSRRAG